MFGRFAKLLRSAHFRPLLASAVLTAAYGFNKVRLDEASPPPIDSDHQAVGPTIQQMLKKILEKQVCDSKDIREGELYYTEVQEEITGLEPDQNKKVGVVIVRFEGKLYAVAGVCSYRDPLEDDDEGSKLTFEDAIVFNNKLYCPHHGCAFDVTSGSVQYGPAMNNLSRLFVEERDGKVILFHPAKIPKSVEPKMELRDLNDLRKTVIVGGDHNATMGFIHGLKQFDYGGQLTVIHRDGQFEQPYHNELLHRCVSNMQKDPSKWVFYSGKEIEKHLRDKFYSKLKFHDEEWYKIHGVDFVFNDEYFRLVNKKYFPYIRYPAGTKVEFDGFFIAQGCLPRISLPLDGITNKHVQGKDAKLVNTFEADQAKLDLPANVFAPFYNKNDHVRMHKFFNSNKVDNLLVMGMNIESLEFCEAFLKQFPHAKVKVLDLNKSNSMTEILGPEIGKQIIKEYTDRGVQFYIKLQQTPVCSNKLALRNRETSPRELKECEKIRQSILKIRKELGELNEVAENEKKKKVLEQRLAKEEGLFHEEQKSIKNAIQIKLDEETCLKGEAMVLFPNNYLGNTESVKMSKYTDIDYNKNNNRVIVGPNSRTDTKRIFAAGSCSSLEFFFTCDRINLINSNMAYEQGMISAFNMMALNVPFAYIPFEKHTFFGKKILYAGVRKHFNSVYIMGSVTDWDFIAFYAEEDAIVAVSATPSKQKEFQVFRESFRLQCSPELPDMARGKWTTPLLYKLIRKLNKSACYKDQIRKLDPAMNIADVIWMQREAGTFVKSEGIQERSNVELDKRGYVKEV